MPNIDFPHPLLVTPRAGNRETRVKKAPELPFVRQHEEERHEESGKR